MGDRTGRAGTVGGEIEGLGVNQLTVKVDLQFTAGEALETVVDGPNLGPEGISSLPTPPDRKFEADQKRVVPVRQPLVGQLRPAKVIDDGPTDSRPRFVELP